MWESAIDFFFFTSYILFKRELKCMVNKRGGNVWLCIPVLVTRLFAGGRRLQKVFFLRRHPVLTPGK